MPRIRVVLVSPENNANIGASARAIANTGLDGLDLVAPGDYRTLETWRTAWRAEDILEGIRVFETLEEAIADSIYVAGFAGRSGMRVAPVTPRALAEEIVALDSDAPVALVFGRESIGLSEDELRRCDRRVSIPTHPRQPSLNLAQAVMVAGYEVFAAATQGTEGASPPHSAVRASHQEVEAALAKLRESFVDSGFATPESVSTRFSEWRALFGRAGLSSHEARMVMALGRKIQNIARLARRKDDPS